MTKRLLITGASGFVGRHCLPFLKEKGFEIFAITSKNSFPPSDGIQWVQYDLLRDPNIGDLIKNLAPTHLLHLAWNATPCKFWTAQDNLDWLKVSIDLLEAFVRHGGKRVVMSGTCAEYDWTSTNFSEANAACIPATLYGACKLALFQVLKAFSAQMGLSYAWGRIFYLYGPHEYPQRFVPNVIKGLLNKEAIPCSHGQQIRDFLHVEDVANAFATLLDSGVQGAVNIGSGQGIALKQVIEKMVAILGGDELIQFGKLQTPPNDPASLIANTTRLQQELQWTPRISLETGLNQTIAWWKENSNAHST